MTDDRFAELEKLLALDTVGVTITRAALTGRGARASAQIWLSNGEELEFDTLREMAKPAVLRVELAACAGATPAKMTQDRAVAAIAVLRDLARHEKAISDDDLAIEWGSSYLQIARPLDVNLADTADRWEAFCDLRALDEGRAEGAAMTAVLIDRDDSRYVRTGHFYPYVRALEPGMSEARITQRMLRIGWGKRGASGRIKATRPGLQGTIGWNFLIVPPGWDPTDPEVEAGSRVHGGSVVMRARGTETASRGEARTPVNRGTAASDGSAS